MNNAQDTEAIKERMKGHIVIFFVLVALTLMTVGLSRLELDFPASLAVALGIAGMQWALVAAFLMHMTSEKRIIFGILIFTAIFVTGLIGLTWGANHDKIEGTEVVRTSYGPPEPALEEGAEH